MITNRWIQSIWVIQVKVAVNAGGVGSFAGFQDGVHAIQLHTAMPEGETPLADVDELVSMAQVVKERLP